MLQCINLSTTLWNDLHFLLEKATTWKARKFIWVSHTASKSHRPGSNPRSLTLEPKCLSNSLVFLLMGSSYYFITDILVHGILSQHFGMIAIGYLSAEAWWSWKITCGTDLPSEQPARCVGRIVWRGWKIVKETSRKLGIRETRKILDC